IDIKKQNSCVEKKKRKKSGSRFNDPVNGCNQLFALMFPEIPLDAIWNKQKHPFDDDDHIKMMENDDGGDGGHNVHFKSTIDHYITFFFLYS
ncbi:hypothetical protein DERF_016042, partial [Dermatophagoides farinae]